MSRRILLLFLYILITAASRAQNMVVNPSFENHVACPNAPGPVPIPSGVSTSVTDWYSANAGSVDYLNSCSPTPLFGVPSNIRGYQQARTGNAYMGCLMSYYAPSIDREYIQSLLTGTLIAG